MRDQAVADYHARRRGLELAGVYGRSIAVRFAARRDYRGGSLELARRREARRSRPMTPAEFLDFRTVADAYAGRTPE